MAPKKAKAKAKVIVKAKAAKKAAPVKAARGKGGSRAGSILRMPVPKVGGTSGLGPLGSALMGMMGAAPSRPTFALPPPPPVGKHPFPPMPPGLAVPVRPSERRKGKGEVE